MDGRLVSGGTLYVVATPLGNLGDLTDRARQTLGAVPLVAAEDTRRARILLDHVEARPRVVSLHAHSTDRRLEEVMDVLGGGQDVALLCDAGTPTVSDPGTVLVHRALEAGVHVVSVPGPSAVTAALSISGIGADRYTFVGFLPRKGTDRKRLLTAVADSPWTTVLFEAPGRLVRLLDDLATHCGADRHAAVARELTKVHEELRAGNPDTLAGYYREHPPRGEVTLVVAGTSQGAEAERDVDHDAVRDRARALLGNGLTRRDVAAQLVAEFPLSRREAYRIATET